MFHSCIGASGRLFNRPLQFPDTGEPGGGAGTPPVTEGSQVNVSPVTPSQAPITPDVTGGQDQKGQTPEQQLQAALSGMGVAQREKAEWVNIAKEYGFNSAAEAKRAFETYKAVNDPAQAGVMVKNYLTQNPDALTGLLRENPMQAAQLFGQVFNNQQPAADPFEGVSTYSELAQVLKQQLIGELKNEIMPVIQPIQQTQQTQHEAQVKAQLNPKIPEAVREQVWSEVKRIGIPMTTIESQPWLIDGLVVQLSGGREKYEESIRSAATTQVVQKVNEKVIQNNNVASLTPGGGVPVTEARVPITDQNKRLEAALAKIRTMNAAT